MSNEEFKVGDTVKLINGNPSGQPPNGSIAKITEIRNIRETILVTWVEAPQPVSQWDTLVYGWRFKKVTERLVPKTTTQKQQTADINKDRIQRLIDEIFQD